MPPAYRFANNVFDAGTGELSVGDGILLLSRQQAAVLHCLIDHAETLVTRQQLYKHVWGDAHVDAEHGLNFCIRRLRRILGDDVSEPRFIQTVRFRGYRFVARVHKENDMDLLGISAMSLVLAGTPAAPAMPAAAAVKQAPAGAGCASLTTSTWLDFWIGEWTVTAGGQPIGTNVIERVLDGCAILEHWQDARGGTGKSLFYPDPPHGVWHQVWVTNRAANPGGVKEKRLVARYDDGTVRFQGEVITPDGIVLDRTTLTPRNDGTVRQLIEVSNDGGQTWRPSFDAIYTRAPAAESADPIRAR